MTIPNPNCCWKEININFYCRAPFQFNDYPSDKHDVEKIVDYDVPCASSVNDNRVYPCCGLFKLEKWEVHYHSCVDIIQPYRQQLLNSETSLCDICHKNSTSLADFVLHQESVHLCLPLFFVLFVILPILLILVYICTLLNLMEVWKQQFL